MRARPLAVFITLAATLVIWLTVRMWFGDHYAVWQVSSLLGAWAPLGAAFVFLYVRAVGGREDSVLAAWLVRAIGMHCVLLWLVGAGDWLRGPPGDAPRFNPDAGAPLVLLGFAPVFGLSLALFGWIRAVARRLDGELIDPLTASLSATFDATPPYRGVTLLARAAPAPSPAVTPFFAGLLGAIALRFGASPALCLGLTPVALALFAVPGWRAVGPSVLSLTVLSAVALRHPETVGAADSLRLGMQWPWLTAGLVAVYLSSVEVRLRVSALSPRAALR